MPSVTVHLHLAERVLDHWRARPQGAPFSPDDRGAVNAFRQGAVGPDIGYMPGAHRPLSDLAHAFRSGDLARSMIHTARTSLERAFSWGWVTHVLADTLIHPIVGCAVGELVHGTPARFVDGDSDQLNHVRVEVGLDALYAERHPELRRTKIRHVFDRDSVAFLTGAYRETYGISVDARETLRSHLLTAKRFMQGLSLAAVSSWMLPDPPLRQGVDAGPVTRFRSMVSRQNLGLAFILPAAPSLWFINAVRDIEENFVQLFLEEFDMQGLGLENVNLDTGRPDLTELHYSGLHRSLDYIRTLGGSPPALPPSCRVPPLVGAA